MSRGLTLKKLAALSEGPNAMIVKNIPRGGKKTPPKKKGIGQWILKTPALNKLFKKLIEPKTIRSYTLGKYGPTDSRGRDTRSKNKWHKDHKEPQKTVFWNSANKRTYRRGKAA